MKPFTSPEEETAFPILHNNSRSATSVEFTYYAELGFGTPNPFPSNSHILLLHNSLEEAKKDQKMNFQSLEDTKRLSNPLYLSSPR